MSKKTNDKARDGLITDIVAALHDPTELSKAHNLSLDDLAVWISDPINRRALHGVCVLSDLQAQVLLSRYRLHAAGRLIKLATEDEPGMSRDVARRACVDLLKMDLKHAGFDGTNALHDGSEESDAAHCDEKTLRRLLYDAVSKPDACDQDSVESEKNMPPCSQDGV